MRFSCGIHGTTMYSWPTAFAVSSEAFHASRSANMMCVDGAESPCRSRIARSEEHTSELQSQSNLVCRLLLEKKNLAAPRGPRKRRRGPARLPRHLRTAATD